MKRLLDRLRGRSSGSHDPEAPSGLVMPDERAPILRSPGPRALPSRPESRASILSHGRGPLLADSDDEVAPEVVLDEEQPPSNGHHRAYGTIPLSPGDLQEPHRKASPSPRKVPWPRYAAYLLISLAALAFIAFASVHIYLGQLVWSQLHSANLEQMASRGTLLHGPDSVEVLSFSGDTIETRISGRAAVDVRRALGWEDKDAPEAGILDGLAASVARRAVQGIGFAIITFRQPLVLKPEHAMNTPEATMLQITLPPLKVPLLYPSGGATSYDELLEAITLDLPIEIASAELLGAFANASWQAREISIVGTLREVHVSLDTGGVSRVLAGFLNKLRGFQLAKIQHAIKYPVPDLPGLRHPAGLVDLKSYSLYYDKSRTDESHLGISASASVMNPLTKSKAFKDVSFDLDVPWHLPFTISFPLSSATSGERNATDILLARVHSLPFHFSKTDPSFPFIVDGKVITAAEGGQMLSEALGVFLASYLKGRPNMVHIRYESSPSTPTAIPTFISTLLAPIMLEIPFPGAKETNLLKNISIEDMSFRPSDSGGMLCSGRIEGELALPSNIASLAPLLDIKGIRPDVLVYDGQLPDNIPGDWPPTPTPANAFGRLRVSDFIPANTTYAPSPTNPGKNIVLVGAELLDVPLSLLDGRGDVFRRYVGKILLGGRKGVQTSVAGQSDVKAEVDGFGALALTALPVEGTFYVGSAF